MNGLACSASFWIIAVVVFIAAELGITAILLRICTKSVQD